VVFAQLFDWYLEPRAALYQLTVRPQLLPP
jgi:hypothetical protein